MEPRPGAVDLGDLRGRTLTAVIIGWLLSDRPDHPNQLFLEFDRSEVVECCTGPQFWLARRPVPDDYGFDNVRTEFRPAPASHPVAALVGRRITGVSRVRWRGWQAGAVLETDGPRAVIADVADDIFASAGTLPVDYADASIDPA